VASTLAPLASAAKRAKRPVSSTWGGHVLAKDITAEKVNKSRDWEWDAPVPETISEVLWSDDEEAHEIQVGGDIEDTRRWGDGGIEKPKQNGGGEGLKSIQMSAAKERVELTEMENLILAERKILLQGANLGCLSHKG
jgi:hypothetical protein